MKQPYRYKLRLCFDGTSYSGWQKQPCVTTLQSVLEKALYDNLGKPISLRGSSRTDAGVHAKDFVAHFDFHSNEIPLTSFKEALNKSLPTDIRIIEVALAPPYFHACFSAKKKHYLYRFTSGSISPFKRLYTTHVREKLCYEKIEQAIPFFIGKHNFSAFANQADKGAAKNNPFKTIYAIDLEKKEDHYLLHFHGNGFLYKMVRNMVGALFAVGHGKIPPQAIAHLIKSQDRKIAPPPAPAKGLRLEKVFY